MFEIVFTLVCVAGDMTGRIAVGSKSWFLKRREKTVSIGSSGNN